MDAVTKSLNLHAMEDPRPQEATVANLIVGKLTLAD